MLDTLGAWRAAEHRGNEPHMQVPAQSAPSQSQQASKSARKLKITPRVRSAIEQMVWHGLKRAEAAQAAGLTEHSLYVALRSPHVKQHYLAELDVLRTSERARNIHRAVEIREQTSNQMASIQAIKLLEQISDDAPAARGSQSLPGLVIVVNGGGSIAASDGSKLLDVVPERVLPDASHI